MLERTPKQLSFWFQVGALYTLDLERCVKGSEFVTLNTVSGLETENISTSSVFMMISTAVQPSTGAKFDIFLTQNTAGESVEIRFMDTYTAARMFVPVKD